MHEIKGLMFTTLCNLDIWSISWTSSFDEGVRYDDEEARWDFSAIILWRCCSI